MSGKSLTIKFLIDNQQARAVNRQTMADFAAQSRAADATANVQTRASNRAATAAIASGKRIVDDATRRAALIDRIETRFAVDDYRRRLKAERDAVAASQRVATEKARQADREARAVQRAEDMAAVSARRQADRAAKEAQRATDAQIRQADRAAKAKQKADAAAAVSARRKADRDIKETQRASDAAARIESKLIADEYRRGVRREQQKIASEKKIEKAKIDASWRAFAQREKAEEKAAAAQLRAANAAKKAAQDQVESQGLVGKATDAVASSVVSLAGSYLGMQGVKYIMDGIAEATQSAADAQTQLADDLARQRDIARELRSMEGKDSNTQGTIADAKFAAKANMKMEEATAFRAAFMGSGAQFEGKTMSEEQYAKFQENAARLAVAKGIDPATMGDLAGKVVGMKDYSKLGDKAADAALADFNQSISVMQRGSGDNATNVKQLSKLSSFAFNDDEARGAFNSHKEMATALSVAAEINPEESEVYVRNALKAVRGFGENDKQADLLKKAGIDATTPFFESFEKLDKVISAEAKERGLKVGDIIKENFGDEREQKAVGAFMNKGVQGGVIKDRLDFADKMASPEVAYDEINKFENDVDSAGPARRAEAEKKRAELEQGAKTVRTKPLYGMAEAQLRDEHKLDTTSSNIRHFFEDTMSNAAKLGFYRGPDAKQSEIIGRGALNLEAQAKAKGEKFSSLQLFRDYGNDEQALSEHLNQEIERLAKKGVDVYGKPSGPLPNYQQQLEMAQSVAELKNANKHLAAIAKPAAPRPLPQGKPAGQLRRP